MDESKQFKYVSEGIVLAGIPLLSYLVTFAYQAGYANYFHIPIELISINITTILVSFSALLGSIFFVYAISNFLWQYAPKDNDAVSFVIRRFIKFAIIFFIGLTPFILKWYAWVIFFIAILLVAYNEFIYPLISQRDKTTYAEKLAAQIKADVNVGKHLLWHEIDKRTGEWFVTAIIYSYMAIAFAYNIGIQSAENKQYFFKINHNTVILAIYDDLAVTANYSPKSQLLDQNLFFDKIDNGKFSLFRERIGKLKYPE